MPGLGGAGTCLGPRAFVGPARWLGALPEANAEGRALGEVGRVQAAASVTHVPDQLALCCTLA